MEVEGGVFDGTTIFRTYYSPTDQEKEVLINGGVIEFSIYSPQLVMQSVQVFDITDEEPYNGGL